MINLIQRVSSASVRIEDGSIIGKINTGLLIYVGFEDSDNHNEIKKCVEKIINLRIFPDKNEKMNLSLLDVNGEILLISNFTLPCDLNESGRRPSFTKSAKPEIASKLYEEMILEYKKNNIKVEIGKFGAMMNVESVCSGPVNFIL